MDYMEIYVTIRTINNTSVVFVVSPLNALIRDQVTKLKQSGLKACILKGDRVASDDDDCEGEQ